MDYGSIFLMKINSSELKVGTSDLLNPFQSPFKKGRGQWNEYILNTPLNLPLIGEIYGVGAVF